MLPDLVPGAVRARRRARPGRRRGARTSTPPGWRCSPPACGSRAGGAALIDGVLMIARHDLHRLLRRRLPRPVPGLPDHPRRPDRRVVRHHARRHRAAPPRLRRGRPVPTRRAATASVAVHRARARSSAPPSSAGAWSPTPPPAGWTGRATSSSRWGSAPSRRPGQGPTGGSVGLRQPRRAARARPGLRRDVRGPAREGPPPGVLSATRPDWTLSLLETHCTVRAGTPRSDGVLGTT